MFLHSYIAEELIRQRRADQLAAADNFRRARALPRQRGGHRLRSRLATSLRVPVVAKWSVLRFRLSIPSVRHRPSGRADEPSAP